MSLNFFITWEQLRKSFLFSARMGKVRKGRSYITYIFFDHFALEKKGDSEVIKVTVNAKAVRRITIVKSFENGMSVLENRGKFIYT